MASQNWNKFKTGFVNYFKTNYKDWKWWYKLTGFLLGLTGLLMALIAGLVDIHLDTYTAADGSKVPTWWIPTGTNTGMWDYDSYLLMYFSYFTNQSNLFVLIWFAYALIFPKKEGTGKLLSFTGSLLVATYISITAIIWTFMLLPASLAVGSSKTVAEWFGSIFLHIIVPSLLVVYVVMFMRKVETVKTKTWLKRSYLIMIYPVIYGIVMLLRGEARYQSGFNSTSSYPYFFLQIHDTVFGIPGWVWFLIAIIAIIGIAVGFSTLYVWAINYHRGKIASASKNDAGPSSTPPTNNSSVDQNSNSPTNNSNKPVENDHVNDSSTNS